jgi:putative transposase
MSFYHNRPIVSRRFRLVSSTFLQKDGLHFAEALPEARIQEAFDAEGVDFAQDDDAVYTPSVTLWASLSQVLHKGEQRSCLAAVARVLVLMVAVGRQPCAKNSGAYCRARAKLSEVVLRRLTTEVARGCERAVPDRWLWHRRHVLLADGTTATMSDTQSNQGEYPQHVAQKPGLGFPILRSVVLLSLATAMVHSMALGPYAGKETGETALFRQLLAGVDSQTIFLADRYYCSYFLLAMALLGQRDFVVRLHQRRKLDLSKTRRLGANDHLVAWTRPAMPDWMDQASYPQIPESMSLRLIKVQVQEPGFRVESLWVVTTLTDVRKYPREDIADLYRRRWLVELDIRAIKKTMGMDVLRCKSPAMVRQEIWTCLLVYNLIRKAMLEAAYETDLAPRELSFTTAMQTIAASLGMLAGANEELAATLIAAQIASLIEQIVGDRPNRVEPRAVKRRWKPIALLTKPRDEAQAELLRGASR